MKKLNNFSQMNANAEISLDNLVKVMESSSLDDIKFAIQIIDTYQIDRKLIRDKIKCVHYSNYEEWSDQAGREVGKWYLSRDDKPHIFYTIGGGELSLYF